MDGRDYKSTKAFEKQANIMQKEMKVNKQI